MRRLIAAAATIVVAFAGVEILQEPSSASFESAMSTSEYNWIDTTIPDANTQQEVKNHCDCAGVNIWNGTHNGNDAKASQYRWNSGRDGSTVSVFYVMRDDKWVAYTKFWCLDDCHEGDF